MPPLQLTDEEIETVITVLKDKRDSSDTELPADLDDLIEKIEASQLRSATETPPETAPGAA